MSGSPRCRRITFDNSVNVSRDGGAKSRRFQVHQIAAEHDPEMFRMGFGKAEIRLRRCDELRVEVVTGGAQLRAQTPRQLIEAARGDFGQQAARVTEMVFWRRVRHAGASCALAQRETLQAAFAQYLFGGVEQSFFQIAVVVAGLFMVGILAESILTM